MTETARESAILATQTRFKLYDLAREKWPESHGDPVELSKKLAKTMLESGIYLDNQLEAGRHTAKRSTRAPQTRRHQERRKRSRSGPSSTSKSEEKMVVGDIQSHAFHSEEEAKAFAMEMEQYQDWHEDTFDEDGYKVGTPPDLTFKKSRGETYSRSTKKETKRQYWMRAEERRRN